MARKARARSEKLAGFLYRIPGPGGNDRRWIARSVHGHVAHGKTPEAAARNLAAGLAALAKASGQTLTRWWSEQRSDSIRVLRAGELVQT